MILRAEIQPNNLGQEPGRSVYEGLVTSAEDLSDEILENVAVGSIFMSLDTHTLYIKGPDEAWHDAVNPWSDAASEAEEGGN